MLDKLKAKKAEIARLREERGATDPILIIAGIAITLILLVGGSFAISGFIANANNLNAKGDLDRVATAQAAFLAERDSYSNNVATLGSSSIGFTPTAGNSLTILTTPTASGGWVAVTESASGTRYARTSSGTAIIEVGSQGNNIAALPGTLVLPNAGNAAANTTFATAVLTAINAL
jgi:hypothetical protein